MEILFLGVGEACDENLPNTSLLIFDRSMVLLDCGFSVPHQFFKFVNEPDLLSAVWISHFHGDHYFGLPLLLLRFWEENRIKPLYIVGQPGLKEKVESAMDMAYPSFRDKLKYELIFVELTPLKAVTISGFNFLAAYSKHSQKNMSLRLEGSQRSIYYSGDGKPSENCFDLAKGVDLMVHECFLIEGDIEGHGSVKLSVDFAEASGVNKLAIVHMQREERKRFKKDMINTKNVEIILPGSGDKLIL